MIIQYSDAGESFVSVRIEQSNQRVRNHNRPYQNRTSDSDRERFNSMDSGGSFPAPPASNASSGIQYKSESGSGSYKSDRDQERYPHFDTQSKLLKLITKLARIAFNGSNISNKTIL